MAAEGTPGLLGLPPPIRWQIYDYAGLLRYCPIDIQGERSRLKLLRDDLTSLAMQKKNNPYRLPYTTYTGSCYLARWINWPRMFEHAPHRCQCPHIPVALLRVSKAMHADVEWSLFAANRFVLSVRTSLGLMVKMPDSALVTIVHLHIHLNLERCPLHGSVSRLYTPRPDCTSCNHLSLEACPMHKSRSGCATCTHCVLFGAEARPRRMHRIERQVTELCARLGRVSPSGRLKFSFSGDCVDVACAEAGSSTAKASPSCRGGDPLWQRPWRRRGCPAGKRDGRGTSGPRSSVTNVQTLSRSAS